jgi:hypothetical protein
MATATGVDSRRAIVPEYPTYSFREAAGYLGVHRSHHLAAAAAELAIPTDRALSRADLGRVAERLGVEVEFVGPTAA